MCTHRIVYFDHLKLYFFIYVPFAHGMYRYTFFKEKMIAYIAEQVMEKGSQKKKPYTNKIAFCVIKYCSDQT